MNDNVNRSGGDEPALLVHLAHERIHLRERAVGLPHRRGVTPFFHQVGAGDDRGDVEDDVTRRIEAALRRRSFRRAQEISVVVNGGTVTLCGQLDSSSERNAARLAAWRAPGVRNVVDQTTIAA